MKYRDLYLAAYDISDPSRLRAILDAVKGFATGGQKSVYECFLSQGERDELIKSISRIIEPSKDSFILLRLDPRAQIKTLGIAVPPEDPPFFYFG